MNAYLYNKHRKFSDFYNFLHFWNVFEILEANLLLWLV